MKRFLKNVALCIAIFAGISLLLSVCIYSVFDDRKSYFEEYETCLVRNKIQAFRENKAQYNTIFFGTSKIHRHIMPEVIDSVLGNTKSFNAGAPSFYPYRLFDFIEQTLVDSPRFENAFIELNVLGEIGPNYDAPASIFSYNFDRIRSALTYLEENKASKKSARSYKTSLARLALYKYFGFSIAKRVHTAVGISTASVANIYCESPNFLKTTGGVHTLDDEAQINKEMLSRKEEMLKSVAQNPDKFKGKGLRVINSTSPADKVNYAETQYFKTLLQTTRHLQKNAKNVYFIISPRPRREWWPIFKGHKQELEKLGFCVFDFSDPNRYPDFYNVENSFDKAHLNEKGAILFSKTLASEVLARQAQCQ